VTTWAVIALHTVVSVLWQKHLDLACRNLTEMFGRHSSIHHQLRVMCGTPNAVIFGERVCFLPDFSGWKLLLSLLKLQSDCSCIHLARVSAAHPGLAMD